MANGAGSGRAGYRPFAGALGPSSRGRLSVLAGPGRPRTVRGRLASVLPLPAAAGARPCEVPAPLGHAGPAQGRARRRRMPRRASEVWSLAEGCAPPTTFQDIVLAMHRFWADRGCLLWQPYDVEKGAGTMNPATFFRCLGPEPWNVAYVEPSRRPADGRYGQNPNRLYQHWQYQVILKPSPADVLDVYLRSLEAVGIRREEHDVRFVEDNWEWPAGGAWGLGWEVWCDGMEITQFTYFQQVGGLEVRPVAAEITIGLERLASFIQGAPDVQSVRWAPGITYGEVFGRAEYEHSKYSFELADPALLRRHFDEFESEARRLFAAGLCLPGYDFLLKCSHTFNVLEARGAVAPAQRAAYIGRMQRLARQAAVLYLRQREEAGFPLLGGRAAGATAGG
jgi:glycyl-tRNA synthetase alpha chain